MFSALTTLLPPAKRAPPTSIRLLTATWMGLALLSIAAHAQENTRPEIEVSEPAMDEREDVAPEAALEPNVVELEDYRDPLKPVNRVIFRFNDFATRYALVPVSKGYIRVVPRAARRSIGNFFDNVKTPIRAVNHLFQGRPKKSVKSIARFGINTTIGVAGLFDPATNRFDMPIQPADFESTLARYGAGYGIYLELPLFGPSDLRNGSGRIVDYFLNPIPYFTDNPERIIIQGADFVQDFAPSADEYEALREETEDPYTFFRNLYLQGAERDAIYDDAE